MRGCEEEKVLNKKLWVATAVLPLVAASLWAGSTASAQPKAGLHGRI